MASQTVTGQIPWDHRTSGATLVFALSIKIYTITMDNNGLTETGKICIKREGILENCIDMRIEYGEIIWYNAAAEC